MNIALVMQYVGYVIYGVLGLIALWGAFCVVMAWRRVGQTQFRNEKEQVEFLGAAEGLLSKQDYRGLAEMCSDDPRALPQLALLLTETRTLGFARVRAILLERFQRDVLAELDHRLTWVKTVIKTAPMVGLLGTVIGMMGAFNKLSTLKEPEKLASDIMLALITTACGLAIAIPLVMAIASINVRIGRLEDLVGSGLTRLLEAFRQATGYGGDRPGPPGAPKPPVLTDRSA